MDHQPQPSGPIWSGFPFSWKQCIQTNSDSTISIPHITFQKKKMEVKKVEAQEQESVSKDDGHKELEMKLGGDARGSLLSRGARFSSISDFLSFMDEGEVNENNDNASKEEGGKVAMEVNKAETETIEEQSYGVKDEEYEIKDEEYEIELDKANTSEKKGGIVAKEKKKSEKDIVKEEGSVDKDKEDVTKLGNEAGGSLLTRGVKFSSVCDFLSFVNEGEAATEDQGEQESGRVQLYPTVKLKRLSLKNGRFVGKKGFRREPFEGTNNEASESQDGKEDLVDKHAIRKGKGNKYQCMLCVYSSGHRNDMRKHLEGTHDLGVGWDCDKCGKHFKLRYSFLWHKIKAKVKPENNAFV